MGKRILCSRGSYYESKSSPFLKGGMFQLFPPLISPVTPVIITSGIVEEKDIYAANAYLDNEKLFHNFGQAWGTVAIDGEILLGSAEFAEEGLISGITNTVANGLRAVELYVSLNRASVARRPVILSALRYAKPVQFFLTHYIRGRMNIEFNIVSFSIRGIAVSKSADNLVGAVVNQFI